MRVKQNWRSKMLGNKMEKPNWGNWIGTAGSRKRAGGAGWRHGEMGLGDLRAKGVKRDTGAWWELQGVPCHTCPFFMRSAHMLVPSPPRMRTW